MDAQSVSVQDINIQVCTGQEARKYFEDIARIRIALFSEYPYLYKGTVAYEQNYLETYFCSPDAVIILVFDKNELVGFSNSIPLTQESDEITAPFIYQGLAVNEYLYIGEVMLYPHYRGKGILRKFFEFHENKARKEGYVYTVFMTVERPGDHPCKPASYKPVDPIWEHFGYAKIPNLQVYFSWTQVDTHKETDNVLALWQKNTVKF